MNTTIFKTFINRRQSSIPGVVFGIGTMVPIIKAIDISPFGGYDTFLRSLLLVNPIISFTIMKYNAVELFDEKNIAEWQKFVQQKRLYQQGRGPWPHTTERNVWKLMTGMGGRAGSTLGLISYLAFANAINNDYGLRKSWFFDEYVTEYNFKRIILFPLMGTAFGAIVGRKFAQVMTSRLLWGLKF